MNRSKLGNYCMRFVCKKPLRPLRRKGTQTTGAELPMPREYANVKSSFIIVMISELVTFSSLSFCSTSTKANLSVMFDR